MAGESSQYTCPKCGHQRTATQCWDCDFGGDRRIGILELVTVVVTTTVLQPFLEAIVRQAGEEVWPKIAGLVRARRRRNEIDGLIDDADVLEIVATESRLVTAMPKQLSADAARDLQAATTALAGADGWFHLSYNAAARTWMVRQIDPPQGRGGG